MWKKQKLKYKRQNNIKRNTWQKCPWPDRIKRGWPGEIWHIGKGQLSFWIPTIDRTGGKRLEKLETPKTKPKHSNMTKTNHKQDIKMTVNKTSNSNNQTWLKDNHVWRESQQARHPTDMVNGNSHSSTFVCMGDCWSTYIHKRPNIGNALRDLFTGTQSEKDGSNKARVLSHMSLGVISTKQVVEVTLGWWWLCEIG